MRLGLGLGLTAYRRHGGVATFHRGRLSATLAAVTLAGTAKLALTATVAATLPAIALAATGALAIKGATSATLDPIALNAAGTLQPGTYPAGVVAAGTNTVTAWDTATTAGLTNPGALVTATAANLPAGTSEDTNGFYLPVGTYTISNRAFEKVVYIDGAADVTTINCSFSAQVGGTTLVALNVNGGTTAVFRPQNCLFDMTNLGKLFASGIYQSGGSIYGDDCKLINAALNFHNLFGNAVYARWRRSLFKDFGKKAAWNANPALRDHCEPFHVRKGLLDLDSCRLDNLGNTFQPSVATSSGPFPEADGVDVGVSMASCVVTGSSYTLANWVMQFGDAGGDTNTSTVTLTQNALDSAASGVISKGTLGRLYGSSNYDLDAGTLLTLPYDAYATQGSLSATFGAVTLAGTAAVGRATQGSLSATLGAVTLSATGGNGSPTLTIYWSGTDKGADQVRSNNNLTISSTSNGGRQLARTNAGVTDGIKRYFEMKIESAASGMAIGVCRGDAPLGTSLGGADESVAIQFNGDVQRSGGVIGDTGGNLTAGEYIGVKMDTFDNQVSFIRGGTEYGPYHTLSIANVSDPYAAVGVEHNTATAGVTLNTGSSAFNYSLPSGYTAWGP